jgi:predicted RNA-binding Zn ribbon-like protein
MSTDPLDLVVAFVNTLDPETGIDEIGTPEALAAWLGRREAIEPVASVGRPDAHRAAEVREALRAHLAANDGALLPASAIEVLDRQARRSRVALRFGEGVGELRVGAPGVDGALGRMLAAVAVAMADGSWSRYKACRAEDCRWAFVDRSRNGSRHWCDMQVCGNREKVRAFRARASRDG